MPAGSASVSPAGQWIVTNAVHRPEWMDGINRNVLCAMEPVHSTQASVVECSLCLFARYKGSCAGAGFLMMCSLVFTFLRPPPPLPPPWGQHGLIGAALLTGDQQGYRQLGWTGQSAV